MPALRPVRNVWDASDGGRSLDVLLPASRGPRWRAFRSRRRPSEYRTWTPGVWPASPGPAPPGCSCLYLLPRGALRRPLSLLSPAALLPRPRRGFAHAPAGQGRREAPAPPAGTPEVSMGAVCGVRMAPVPAPPRAAGVGERRGEERGPGPEQVPSVSPARPATPPPRAPADPAPGDLTSCAGSLGV